ncbi:MAG TPA: hypothetical protein DEF00_02910 [Candidatus Taylorbacteria bacterium]|nr:hypothetical protein [Candidatus Taylorbacteria bacterium]
MRSRAIRVIKRSPSSRKASKGSLEDSAETAKFLLQCKAVALCKAQRNKTQNTDVHKKPSKTQNIPNLPNTSSFVLWYIVFCLDFWTLCFEKFVFPRFARGSAA